MRRYLVSVCQFVLILCSICPSISSAIPFEQLDTNIHGPLSVLYAPSKEGLSGFTFKYDIFLSNIMMFNSKTTGISNFLVFGEPKQHCCKYFGAEITITKMLMSESVFAFFHRLRLYICFNPNFLFLFGTSSAGIADDFFISNLFALIYSWWYKSILVNYFFEGKNSDDLNIYEHNQAQVKEMLKLLFVLYPSLMNYSFNEASKASCQKTSMDVLRILHPKIIKAYVWDKKPYLIDPRESVYQNCKIIMDCEELYVLCNKYVELYDLIYIQDYTNDSEAILSLYSKYGKELDCLTRELGKLRRNVFDIINDNSYINRFPNSSTNQPDKFLNAPYNTYLACIQFCISGLSTLFSILSNTTLNSSLYIGKFSEKKTRFSALFFDCIDQAKEGVCANMANIVWIPGLLCNDAHLLEIAQKIRARNELTGTIADFIISKLNDINSPYYNHFFGKYNCWIPGLLKFIGDYLISSFDIEVKVLGVESAFSVFCENSYGIKDLLNLYYAVKTDTTFSREKMNNYTSCLLKQFSGIYIRNHKVYEKQNDINMVLIQYAIHILGYNVSVVGRNCDEFIWTFGKCIVYRDAFDNYIFKMNTSKCPGNLRMSDNEGDSLVVS